MRKSDGESVEYVTLNCYISKVMKLMTWDRKSITGDLSNGKETFKYKKNTAFPSCY